MCPTTGSTGQPFGEVRARAGTIIGFGRRSEPNGMLRAHLPWTEPLSGGEENGWAMRQTFGEGAAEGASALAEHGCRPPGNERLALRSDAGREGQLHVEGNASLRRYVENHVRAEWKPAGTNAFGLRGRSEETRHLRR
jgi:hypothetical protein